jgi:PAS domain S-box-containing protein
MTDPSPASNEAWHFQPAWCRVTLASIGDAVITANTQGQVTFLNAVAESLTGWTLAEAAGQPLDSVFHIISEESRQPVESPTVQALRFGLVAGPARPFGSPRLLLAKDGSERPIDENAAPIRNDQGEVAGVVLVFRDSSERRRHERVAQQSLHYAENIIATLREPFVVLDKSLRVLTANAAFYRAFQASKEETEGRFVYDLGNGQWDIPQLRMLLVQVVNDSHPVEDFEVEHSFPALGIRNMLLNARRFPPESNDPELVLLAIEDITDRRQAEAAMQHSEVRYRRLFQKAKDGILILDADTGKVIDANPFMTALLGYSYEEFLGKELWEIGLFHDIQESRAAYRELQEKGYVRYENLPLESRSGHKVEVEFVSNVYAENHHQVVQCNVRDITERSRLQRLTQEQAAALADLDRRKDEFLAMLSHELRNPLAPILNAALLLRLHSNRNRLHGIENPVLQQSAAIIERQVGQLTRIVDELLEISRITTGRIQLHQERVALAVVVENAVATVRSLIDQRKHVLTVSLPTPALWLHADAARLEQVVVNLLTNAAKYTDLGGRLWLTVHQEGEEAVLRVRDTGVGIAPEILPRIFDLFTQAERSLDRSQGGLGIGLALVQRLVAMHGGTVTVSSALGQGSEFVVRLPVVPPHQPQASATPLPTAQPTGPSLRVLVVDDNVDTVTTLAMLVQASGHEARTAYDGPAVLEAALDYRPHVVLLDIGLPGLNGFEIAKRLRQQPALQNAVLVAMTGYGQESDRKRSQEAGFDHHLVKPGDFGKVLQILATVSELPAP